MNRERRALSDRALHGNPVTQRVADCLADRETESGTTVREVRRGAGLFERLEDGAQPLDGNADSRVAHEETQWLSRAAVTLSADHDAALVRKPDGIAREVDEDLLEENRVAL